MFRSSTILREFVQSLAKVTFQLKHSVKLCRCILCGDVAARRETACVLFAVQTDKRVGYSWGSFRTSLEIVSVYYKIRKNVSLNKS